METTSMRARLPPAVNSWPRAGEPAAQQAAGREGAQGVSKRNVRGRTKTGQGEVGGGKVVGLMLWPDWGLAVLLSILY